MRPESRMQISSSASGSGRGNWVNQLTYLPYGHRMLSEPDGYAFTPVPRFYPLATSGEWGDTPTEPVQDIGEYP